MRTLIAEDESAAREGLWELLKKENDIEIVGVSGSGQEALEAINQLQPDLIFLDAHIAESGGIELLKQVPCGSAPVIVFVATNEALAARAFDFQAADYLVKPYRQDRLHHALRRVREQFNQSHTNQLHTRIEALLADLREESRSAERIAVKSGRRILFLRPEEIVWIEAADNYVNVHAAQESHLLRVTMNSFEGRLSCRRFVRISRSAMVNIEHIKQLQPVLHGEYEVVLGNGTKLTLSRGYRDKLRQVCLV
jgi:two-component system LytT family response regulator